METEIVKDVKDSHQPNQNYNIDNQVNTKSDFENKALSLQEIHKMVRDLLTPNPRIYWPDLVLSSGIGWISALLCYLVGPIYFKFIFGTLAVFALFRGLFFIHEISHLSKTDLPGFTFAWNALIGIPLLVPSFLYESVHLDHHKRGKYATLEDPEYLPLVNMGRFQLVLFAIKPLFFPIVFLLRFLILTPIGLVIPKFHRVLETYLSALIINPKYKRVVTPFYRKRIYQQELAILTFWSVVGVLLYQRILPVNSMYYWYAILVGVAFVNQIRTIAAHRYRNDGISSVEYEDQLLDTVNVTGGIFSDLWAPVGARYHALHHYLPKLPYHNLGRAHRRILKQLPSDNVYTQTVEVSLWSALKNIWTESGRRKTSV